MLSGKSINLRNVRQKDLEGLYLLNNLMDDPGEFMPIKLQSESTFMAHFARDGFWAEDEGQLLIENKTNEIVGIIGFRKTIHYMDGYEIFYRLFEAQHRGKGYMSEALAIFIRFIFQSKPVNRLQAVTSEGNQPSEAILYKLGFQFEGTLRQARQLKGMQVDLRLFSILKQEVLKSAQ